MMRRSLLAAAILALALPLARAQEASPAAPPDAKFTTRDGKTVHLADFRGKQAVVLLFQRGFTGDFACFYCSTQTRDYKANYGKFKAAGAEVIMVLPGSDDPRGYLEHVGENDKDNPDPAFDVPFPVVGDTDFSATKTFHVPFNPKAQGFPVSQPATFVLGKDGTIVYEYHGKNPSDRPAVETVLAAIGVGATPAPKPETGATPAAAGLAWVEYEDGLRSAREQKKPILLEFYADW